MWLIISHTSWLYIPSEIANVFRKGYIQLRTDLLLVFNCSVVSNSFVWLWTVARQALSMGFSRQEYWSGLPFPPPGDLPDPGIEPASPALAGGFFTNEPPGKPTYWPISLLINLAGLSALPLASYATIEVCLFFLRICCSSMWMWG